MKQFDLLKHLFVMINLLFVCCLKASAYNFEVDGIYYNITNSSTKEVEVTMYYYSPGGRYSNPRYESNYEGNITIPSTVTYNDVTYSVTSIGHHAFDDCDVTSVVIPNSVTSIGSQAFNYCRYLTSIEMSNSIKTIGDNAFSSCSKLASITLPNSLNSIGNSAFIFCESLTSIVIPNSVYNIGDHAFRECHGLKSAVIGNAVTKIADYAFYNCYSLTSVTIPHSATSIGQYAFLNCYDLPGITIPNSVTYIASNAFSGCHFSNFVNNSSVDYTVSVADIEQPDGLLIKDNEAVYCRKWATSVTIPNTVTSIGSGAFRGCSSLTHVTIPSSVTSIGNYAFENCDGLTEVAIPNSVTSIGGGTFYNCDGLTDVVIPSSVTNIASSTFYGCEGLINISIPNSIESIGTDAFYGCTSLESITIPNSVKNIWNRAFYGCTSLTSINMTSSVASIENETFRGCSSLVSVSIPNSVTKIGYNAFQDCSSLTSVSIPYSVTTIESNAFQGCSSLGTVIIPNGVKYLNEYTFRDCSKLTSVTIGTSVTGIGLGTFYGCTSLESITIPNSVCSIGNFAFSGCSSMTSVYIPSSVTSIGVRAFEACSNIEEMTIPFVGRSASATTASSTTLFGSIFAEYNYTGSTAVKQYYDDSSFETYYIPSKLKKVTVTGGNLLYGAFYNCSTLSSITISNYVTKIGDKAFYNCTGLTSVTIPSSVTNIGTDAYKYCSNVKELIYANGCQTALRTSLTSITSVTIPNTVTSIAEQAFSSCSRLSTVTIPSSIKSIGSYAFYGCSNIQSINISDLKAWCECSGIGNLMSYGSSNKQILLNGVLLDGNVKIPTGTTKIENSAFYNYTRLTSITIPNTVTSIGSNAFYGCSGLTSIVVPTSVKTIGDYAFQYCRGLSSFTIPNSVTSIGNSVFASCSGLSSVTIPNTVTSIGNYAFSYCSGIKSISIPNSVTSIGTYAFSGCSGLTSIDIPNSVTSFGTYAFQNCTSLTSIVIPNSVKSIGSYLFYNCTGLTSVTIPNTITSIGSYAFYGCTSLPSVDIPTSVTSINGSAFKNCNALSSITIPKSVTYIGSEAFSGCTNLTSVTCYGVKPPSVSSNTFNSVPKTIPLYVQRASISAYKSNSVWSEFANISAIPTYELYMDDKMNISGTELEVPIYMDNIMEICNLQFDIVLPNKVDIYYGENDDEEEVYWVTKGERAKTAHTVAVSKNSTNTYRVIISSTSNAVFKDADKSLPIAYIKLIIDESIYEGSHKIQLTNVKLTSYNEGTTSLISAADANGLIVVPPSYSVEASSSNTTHGNVNVVGEKYDATTHKTKLGSSVTLIATPNEGYHFAEWTENNTTLSTDNPYTLSTIETNHTIKGVFAPNPYTVTFTVDGETYSSGKQNYGEVVVVPIAPTKIGHKFIGWKDLTETTTVPANDVTYEAEFSINQYTVKFVADGQTIYEQKQDYNSDIIVPTAPEKERYAFVSWGDVLDKVPAYDVTYTADYVLIGDLYEDQEINIGDLTSLVGIILDAAPDELDPHVFKKADIYQDNKINVADYTSLVGMILHGSNTSAKSKTNVDDNMDDVAINMDNFHMTSADEGCISINLESSNKSIAALQFDIVIPSDMSFNVADVISLHANLKQSVSYNLLDDSTLRVMVYSANNSAIRADKLMDINLASIVEGDHDITLKNIVCSTANNNVKELENIVYRISSSEITSIAATNTDGLSVKVEDSTMIIKSQKTTTVKVVSASGAVVAHDNINRNKEMRISLPQGVYLVNGTKYIVK